MSNELKAAALNAAVSFAQFEPGMNSRQKAREIARCALQVLQEFDRLEKKSEEREREKADA